MRSFLISILLFCLTSMASFAASDAPIQKIKLTYKAYWGGFVISKVYSSGLLGPHDYTVDVTYKVTGLASLFSNMESKISVVGKRADDGSLKPLIFDHQGSWSKYFYKTKTTFQESDGKIIAHDFEFKFEDEAIYIPVSEEQRYGPDMVSFYLGITLDEKKMEIGQELKHHNAFGGFFLLDIACRCVEKKPFDSKRSIYKGEVLVCEYNDKIIDGKFKLLKEKKKSKKKKKRKKKKNKAKEPTPIQIWYGKLDDIEAMVPVYSEFEFGWGKVRVYLSEIEVTTQDTMP